jgi:hypothetical protein
MTTSSVRQGFDYYLTTEQIRRYRRKPVELRLEWLYQGNLLRMHLPERIKKRQDRFRR